MFEAGHFINVLIRRVIQRLPKRGPTNHNLTRLGTKLLPHKIELTYILPNYHQTGILGVKVSLNGLRTVIPWLDVLKRAQAGEHATKYNKLMYDALQVLEKIQASNSEKA